MPTYTVAPKTINTLVKSLVADHYPLILEAEVTFDLLLAAAPRDDKGNPKGPALKLHNWPALAIIRVVPLKGRVAGRADVEICLDGDQWDDLTEPKQLGLLDHELYHVSVLTTATGGIKEDDCGRPRIKLRPHDWQGGVFYDVLGRHGDNSQEHTLLTELEAKTQGLFAWAEVG